MSEQLDLLNQPDDQDQPRRQRPPQAMGGGGVEVLRKNPMMGHLVGALETGEDLGHYGRLVFAMVARHFLEPGELADWLARDRTMDEHQARGLVEQVNEADYNPPGPGKIREWQAQQDFPIIPPGHAASEDANVYQDLKFPDHVYERIGEYHQERAEAREAEHESPR